MIPNHPRFIEAIQQRRKVNIRFYSQPDHGVLDRVCAPLDYGPGDGPPEGPNRYWLWDYADTTDTPTLGLVPEQVVDLRVLGDVFDPADVAGWTAPWSIPRTWDRRPILAPVS